LLLTTPLLTSAATLESLRPNAHAA